MTRHDTGGCYVVCCQPCRECLIDHRLPITQADSAAALADMAVLWCRPQCSIASHGYRHLLGSSYTPSRCSGACQKVLLLRARASLTTPTYCLSLSTLAAAFLLCLCRLPGVAAVTTCRTMVCIMLVRLSPSLHSSQKQVISL